MNTLTNYELEQINGGGIIIKIVGAVLGVAIFGISAVYGFLFPNK